jgi:hypothetical protein
VTAAVECRWGRAWCRRLGRGWRERPSPSLGRPHLRSQRHTSEVGASPIESGITGRNMDSSNVLSNQQQQSEGITFQSPTPSLPTYGFPPSSIHARSSSSPLGNSLPKGTKKRKLSSYANPQLSQDSDDDDDKLDDSGAPRNGSSRKARPSGTKRACNQCRQQKVSHTAMSCIYYLPAHAVSPLTVGCHPC